MRTPIDRMLDAVEWEELEGEPEGDSALPYATHSGWLDFLGTRVRVYVLNDGRRVFDASFFDAPPSSEKGPAA